MINALLITLREGLEASLIVGIILAYLNRTGNRQGYKPVWVGVVAAVLVSLAAGVVIYLTAGELTGRGEQIFEGIAMLIAAGVLTWMVFWMRKQSRNIKQNLQAQVDSALGGSSFGLITLSFVAVVREGIETALFLFAATSVTGSAVQTLAGGLIGLAAAVIIGYTIYKGTSRLNLRVFFGVTGFLLIIFAAGLLAHGIHEFEEAGIIPPVIAHVWDISRFLPDNAGVGGFLKALLGYNANPSLVEVTAYVVYLVIVLIAYFFSGRKKISPSPDHGNTGSPYLSS